MLEAYKVFACTDYTAQINIPLQLHCSCTYFIRCYTYI